MLNNIQNRIYKKVVINYFNKDINIFFKMKIKDFYINDTGIHYQSHFTHTWYSVVFVNTESTIFNNFKNLDIDINDFRK